MDLRDLIRGLEGAGFLRANWAEEGTWTPVFTGFSADPAGVIARYVKRGKRCRVDVTMPNNGTSNGTTFGVSAPFPAAVVSGMYWGNTWWTAVDNGSFLTAAGRVFIASGGTAFTLYKDMASGAWANANGKSADFGLEYEIN